MKPIVRNIIAVVLGLVVGNVVNMSLIQVGHSVFPTGIDANDMDQLVRFMEGADSKFFVFPFIAHAIGTLFGAFIASLFSKNRKMGVALIIGVFFLIGGLIISFMIPAPSWFVTMDLLIAYIPMAFMGYLMARSLKRKK